MRKRLFLSLILAFFIAISFVSHAQEAQEEEAPIPESIIVEPKEQEFSIDIRTDRQNYSPKERLNITLNLSHDAYVYVYDINPQGKVTLLFPNGFQRNNFLEAGNHRLPSTQEYSFIVSGPLGIERLQVIALLQPMPILELTSQQDLDVHVFPQLSTEPSEFTPQVREMIQIYAEPGDWAADWSEFVIKNPSAHLNINTRPEGANVFINDQFLGQTPLEVEVPTGRAALRLTRDGFSNWTTELNLSNREARAIDVRLQPLSIPAQPTTPDASSQPDFNIPAGSISGFKLGFDVGANSAGIFSAGFDMGFASGLGIGASMSFNEDEVPQYYNIGRPIAFPREEIFNLGPEVEAYMKLSVPVSGAFSLSIGGGMAIQERVHVASSQSTYVVRSSDILIVPNGYRDTVSYWTVMGGVGLQLSDHGYLSLGHHNRRGWIAGLTVQF